MKIKYCLFLVMLLSGSMVFAQREASNWFFGYNAGLTWNTTRSLFGAPVGGTIGPTTLL